MKVALDKYNKVLEINPDHALAAQRSAELTFIIRQQQKQADDQAVYERLMTDGADHEQKQDFSLAVSSYTKALDVRPNDPTAQARLDAAKNKLAELESAKANTERYQQLMTDGRNLLKNNELSPAIEKFGEALALKPGDPEAAAEKKKSRSTPARFGGNKRTGNEIYTARSHC